MRDGMRRFLGRMNKKPRMPKAKLRKEPRGLLGPQAVVNVRMWASENKSMPPAIKKNVILLCDEWITWRP